MAAKFTSKLTLHGMEERAVPASMANGILYITGTPFDDVVDVRHVTVNDTNMIQVTENGAVEQFKASTVHLIKFWGLDGDDSFTASTMRDIVAVGGSGNDTIVTSGGNDHLYGGNGRDVLKGGAGNDHIWGGDGGDRIIGGAGNDWLYGEKGNDVLDGCDGNDKLWGGAGLDVEWGGAGNDEFHGAKNNVGLLSAPVTTPSGTAYNYGIQDANTLPGDHDKVWS
ncbi:MAG TPA: calcium-binding protein [Gemmataceae bacterium]|nr:calcium-binding protein [Gemmataceae bacterium]